LLTPTIIVAEQGELWLAALRTSVRRSAPLRVEPTWLHVTAREDVAPGIARSGAAFVVVEATLHAAASDVLQLCQWRETFPTACFIAAVDRHELPRPSSDLVWALREAGAVHVLTSPRRAAEALPLLERHCNRLGVAGEWGGGNWNRHFTTILSKLPPCWGIRGDE